MRFTVALVVTIAVDESNVDTTTDDVFERGHVPDHDIAGELGHGYLLRVVIAGEVGADPEVFLHPCLVKVAVVVVRDARHYVGIRDILIR